MRFNNDDFGAPRKGWRVLFKGLSIAFTRWPPQKNFMGDWWLITGRSESSFLPSPEEAERKFKAFHSHGSWLFELNFWKLDFNFGSDLYNIFYGRIEIRKPLISRGNFIIQEYSFLFPFRLQREYVT